MVTLCIESRASSIHDLSILQVTFFFAFKNISDFASFKTLEKAY